MNAFTHRCTYKYTQIGKEGRGGENFENGIEKYPIPKEFKKANCLRRDADNVDPALARPISQYRAPSLILSNYGWRGRELYCHKNA